jgi:truncated hemoglobin YjbI
MTLWTPPPDDDLPAAHWHPCEADCPRACQATLQWPVRQALADGPWADAGAMVAMPAVPDPPHSLLALCGEAGLRRLVHRHMSRLRLTPLLASANAQTQDCFDCVAERVADFVIESCGGPLYWSERHSPHRGLAAGAGWPVLLDEIGREIWLVQLWHSFADVGLAEKLRADFWHWAEPLSLHLLVPRARRAGVRRYPFHTVKRWFSSALQAPADGASGASGGSDGSRDASGSGVGAGH